MDHRYRPMRGTFVAVGHRADGGSVRFVPDRSADLDALIETRRLRVARDGSVRVRLEGVDAPMRIDEEHKQPLAEQARDALLAAVGFAGCVLDDGIVIDASCAEIRGEIAARAVDVEGNVIGYVGRQLRSTLNARLLGDGFVYPLAYDTQPAADRAQIKRPTILIVEDDEGIQYALEQLFQEDGFVVRLAENLATARQWLASGTVDAVVLDMRLAAGDYGGDLVLELAHDPRAPTVVLLSASPELAVPLAQRYRLAWVPKPFDFDMLVRTVRVAMEMSMRRRRIAAPRRDGPRGGADAGGDHLRRPVAPRCAADARRTVVLRKPFELDELVDAVLAAVVS